MILWYKCPHCGQKLFQIEDGATAKGIKLKCKKCKRIIDVSL